MSFWNKLKKTLGGSAQPAASSASRFYTVEVRCRRCGEVLVGRVNLDSDLSPNYDDGTYFSRKLLSGGGQNRCFQQIELLLTFDAGKHLLSREAVGGGFVDEEPPPPAEISQD